jgi:hypothetical protein
MIRRRLLKELVVAGRFPVLPDGVGDIGGDVVPCKA